jgi:hypothetical protein
MFNVALTFIGNASHLLKFSATNDSVIVKTGKENECFFISFFCFVFGMVLVGSFGYFQNQN